MKKNEEREKRNEEKERRNEGREKRNRESHEEMKKALEKSLQKVHEAQRETQKKLDQASGSFNNKWGEFLENFVQGDLPKLFRKRGMDVHSAATRVRCLRDDNSITAEYDLVVSNRECVVVIETKTTVSKNKLNTFINKLQLFKKRFPRYRNCKLYGGIAYMKADRELLDYAQAKGLFLIQAPGGESNVTIITNSPEFSPTAY